MDKLIDEKTEKNLRDKIDRGMNTARDNLDSAKKMAIEKEEEMAERVREKPIEWVAGAFIAGLLIGKLLSKK
jgi:ElaB/YqjD/DUF883 family membrane-anchored ribosome-binding protein